MKMFTLIIVLLLTTVFPILGNEKNDNMKKKPPMEKIENKNDKVNKNAPFITYKDMKQVMNLAKDKPTVLFFKATWCPSCLSAAMDFQINKKKLKDVNLVVVNYDQYKDLKKRYGVSYQHTFVQVSPDGDAIVKWNGGKTPELLKKIKKREM